MRKSNHFVIVFDLLIAFIFPNFTVLSKYIVDLLPKNYTITLGLNYVACGRHALNHEFPYMAALGYRNYEMGAEFFLYECGGSLISTQLVLTAAHCVKNIDNKVPDHVVLGTTDLVNKDSDAQIVKIHSIIPHPQYNLRWYNNDLAIIILKSKVQVTNSVRPILVSSVNVHSIILQNYLLKTTGFGETEKEKLSNNLMATSLLSIVPTKGCNEIYGDIPQLQRGIDNTMICVRGTISSPEVCRGDSGGPLVLSQKNGQSMDILVGVTAFGVPCGFNSPGVFIAVYPYLSWIDQFIWYKSG